VHLTRRFVGSLRPGGVTQLDELWARDQLLPTELELWDRMSAADRRHAAGVAWETLRILGIRAERPVLAAALLHDVGKIDSGLGTFARAGATVAGMVVRRERLDGRVGRYLAHDRIGAELLRAAGSDALTVAWSREHHLPAERWSLPRPVADALKFADDD
jgi:hypothetical protein